MDKWRFLNLTESSERRLSEVSVYKTSEMKICRKIKKINKM